MNNNIFTLTGNIVSINPTTDNGAKVRIAQNVPGKETIYHDVYVYKGGLDAIDDLEKGDYIQFQGFLGSQKITVRGGHEIYVPKSIAKQMNILSRKRDCQAKKANQQAA